MSRIAGTDGQGESVGKSAEPAPRVDHAVAERHALDYLTELFLNRGHKVIAPICETFRQNDAWIVECWESNTEATLDFQVDDYGRVELLAGEVPWWPLPPPAPPVGEPPIA